MTCGSPAVLPFRREKISLNFDPGGPTTSVLIPEYPATGAALGAGKREVFLQAGQRSVLGISHCKSKIHRLRR